MHLGLLTLESVVVVLAADVDGEVGVPAGRSSDPGAVGGNSE